MKHVSLICCCLLLALTLTSGVTLAQCPNQKCKLENDCYKCEGSEAKEGCSVTPFCQSCTDWICPIIESADLSLVKGKVSVETAALITNGCQGPILTLAQSRETKSTSGTEVGIVWEQNSGPASILKGTFGVQDLFLSGEFLNNSGKNVSSYRLGWIFLFADGSHELIKGKWVPTRVSPHSTQEIPRQNASPAPIKRGARAVKFFVADVKYSDGSSWGEDVNRLVQNLTPKKSPRDLRTRLGT